MLRPEPAQGEPTRSCPRFSSRSVASRRHHRSDPPSSPTAPHGKSDRVLQRRLGPDRHLLCVTRRPASEPVGPEGTDHLFLGTAFDHGTRSAHPRIGGIPCVPAGDEPVDPGLRDRARGDVPARSLVRRGTDRRRATLSVSIPRSGRRRRISSWCRTRCSCWSGSGGRWVSAVSVDEDTVKGRSVQNILAYQLFGERTPVDDVSYLPVGATLRVGVPAPTVDRRRRSSGSASPIASFHREIPTHRSATGRPRGVGHREVDRSDSRPPATLSLSGGLDSRVLLAVLVQDPAL